MSVTVALSAYAKVNLTLGVLGRRADGHHALHGVMQRISLADEVALTPARGICVRSDLPLPAQNTLRTAAERYREATGCGGVEIIIRKKLPAQAGLGAASADAAAVLLGMQRLYGGLSREALFPLALSIGADVPFCLLGGAAVAEGVGELLTPLPAFPRGLPLVIAKGEGGVPTGALFQSLGLELPQTGLTPAGLPLPDHAAFLRAWQAGDAAALAGCLYNALELPALRLCPEIAETKRLLLREGAIAASMTGSGAAVLGVFASAREAAAAARALSFLPYAAACRTL